MKERDLVIRDMCSDDPDSIVAEFAGTHLQRGADHVRRHLDDVAAGTREAITAVLESRVVGYGTLNWRSRHGIFRDASIPEIQDLNVVPWARGCGAGSAILEELERRAALRSSVVGIGVGLYRAYGAAQRLYVERGYVPDGSGVWTGDVTPAEGALVKLDDETVLYMTKALRQQKDA